jgi:hypothetical protein
MSQTLEAIILVGFGFFLGLFAYHFGRNNSSPFPQIRLPQVMRPKEPAGEAKHTETLKPTRGM